MQQQSNKFLKNFFWGASTSAHQVEGGTHNQWTVWELSTAAEKANRAEDEVHNPNTLPLYQLPVWEDIKHEVIKPENYVSGDGIEHYKRYKDDFKLLKELNLNSFRFGIEWARIEPEEGRWAETEIEHYRRYISELRKLGIEPFMNIWHWTNPVWFEQKGGFVKRKNLKYFERFVQKLADELCGEVTYILTINEANNYASISYVLGKWPPQKKNILTAVRVYYNLALAHRRAYKILKKAKPSLQIGVAHHAVMNVAVHRYNPIEWIIIKLTDYVWQNWFYNRTRKYQDFLGANFYSVNYVSWFGMKNPAEPLNDMGWYMEPGRLHELLVKLYKKYKQPIIVTESGLADMHDHHRQWWLDETIKALEKANESGVDLRGYLHWSLLDNFEWAEGWWPKFGLVAVDRQNGMKRTVRPSAKWLAIKIKSLS